MSCTKGVCELQQFKSILALNMQFKSELWGKLETLGPGP